MDEREGIEDGPVGFWLGENDGDILGFADNVGAEDGMVLIDGFTEGILLGAFDGD